MTAQRRVRQEAILRLVSTGAISTQSELVGALRAEGFDVVQTTVSRDVAELGLAKVRSAGGRLVYAPPGAPDADRLRALRGAFRSWALGIESNDTAVVVFTPRGYAAPLAEAVDESHHPLVLATIAGDNTLLVLPRSGVCAADLRQDLRAHLLEGAA